MTVVELDGPRRELDAKLAEKRSRYKPEAARVQKVDREALHRYLWKRTDEQGLVRVHVRNLAAALGVSARAISAIMRQFVEDGRALRIRTEVGGLGIFEIANPEVWRKEDRNTWANGDLKPKSKPKRREIQWG